MVSVKLLIKSLLRITSTSHEHCIYGSSLWIGINFCRKRPIIFRNIIRIQTVNPPGNEIEGARYLKRIFDAERIPCQVFEPSPGRGSLLATLKGNGKKKPILLLNHIDVVPAEKEHWSVDPFAGMIRDGYLYGRGTLDDKSMGIIEMIALLILKTGKDSSKRDVLFFAAADEETGGGGELNGP